MSYAYRPAIPWKYSSILQAVLYSLAAVEVH